jgi:hypothetical protein
MRPSVIRVENQPSIVIILCDRKLFLDRPEYVMFLPFRETIKHMKAVRVPNDRHISVIAMRDGQLVSVICKFGESFIFHHLMAR